VLFMRVATTAIIAGLILFCEAGPFGGARPSIAAGNGLRHSPADLPVPVPVPAHPVPAGPVLAGMQASPAGRLATIRDRGELVVCAASNLPAIAWRNARTGQIEGMDADLANALAARMNLRATFLDTPSDAAIEAVERGTCDLGVGGLGISPARSARVAFTKPFMAGPLAAVTQPVSTRVPGWEGLDREGVVVAVRHGSVAEEVIRQHLQRAELLPVQRPMIPEQEIGAGRADVFVTDYADARRLREEGGWRVANAPGRMGDTLYAYAVPRGDDAWLSAVNAFLAAARTDGLLMRVAQRWGLRNVMVN